VLREIRAPEGATGRYDPELPVIVLRGCGTDADRIRGFAEGADDYVTSSSAAGSRHDR
jgi:DNA-binding response OmpR family regulator